MVIQHHIMQLAVPIKQQRSSSRGTNLSRMANKEADRGGALCLTFFGAVMPWRAVPIKALQGVNKSDRQANADHNASL